MEEKKIARGFVYNRNGVASLVDRTFIQLRRKRPFLRRTISCVLPGKVASALVAHQLRATPQIMMLGRAPRRRRQAPSDCAWACRVRHHLFVRAPSSALKIESQIRKEKNN